MATTNNGQIVDEFENSFQASLAALTNPDHFSVRDSEEIKTGVEQTIQRFLDLAKQMECFFLQKRLLLSVQKPEQIILEDINELKNELQRKEQLSQKYYEKISHWQNLLSDISGSRPPVPILQNTLIQNQQPSPMTPPQPPMGQMLPQASLPPPQVPQHHMPPPQSTQPHGMMPGMGMPPQGPQVMMPNMPPQMHPNAHMNPQMPPQGGLQGPLAYLERTTSNIGMPDQRR